MTIGFLKGKKHSDADFERLVAQESLILETTEEICRILETENISRSELARRLGKSKGFVTQVLSGERNMTLNTAADFAFALGRRFHIHAFPPDGRGRNVHLPLYLPVSPMLHDAGRVHRSATLAAATDLARVWAEAQSRRDSADASIRPNVNLERWSPATQSVECSDAQEGFQPDHEFSLTA
jgi:transcriptional regulator with XRE-family HTH domain